MTASAQTRKKTTWLLLDRVILRVLGEVHKHTRFGDNKCGRDSADCELEACLSPSCKIRLGTSGETSRVSTGEFTVSRHENRSCKYTEDMYRDNDHINIPTCCSVIITSESGDELISLRGQFTGRAEQHLPQHYCITVRTSCTTRELVGEQYSGPFGKSCTDWTLWKVLLWTAHTATESRQCR